MFFFDNKILDFEVKMDNHDELPLPFTYCKDLPGLIQFCQMRWGLSDTVNEIERKEIKESKEGTESKVLHGNQVIKTILYCR